MVIFSIFYLLVFWLIGAGITLKAHSVIHNTPTWVRENLWLVPLVLFAWPGIAWVIMYTSHPVWTDKLEQRF
jgi:hypothetical protein